MLMLCHKVFFSLRSTSQCGAWWRSRVHVTFGTWRNTDNKRQCSSHYRSYPENWKIYKIRYKLIARHKYWDLCISLVVCCNCMAFKIDDDLRFASNWLIDWLLLVLHRIGSIVNWCTETSQLPVKGCTIWFYVHHFRSEDLKRKLSFLCYIGFCSFF